MRSVELLCVLRLSIWPTMNWTYNGLSESMGLAYASVHGAVRGAANSRLYDLERQQLLRSGLLEFLEHGVRYAFPVSGGDEVRGIRTGPDAAPMRDLLVAGTGLPYVWPCDSGKTMGRSLKPLHRVVPEATARDPEFYALMALVDVIRLDESVRQTNLAKKLLRERIGK